MPNILAVHALNAFYGPFQALFGAHIEVAEGEIVAVIGANGAGKSTLLRSIVGWSTATPEAVVFAGEPIGGEPPELVAARGLSMVPEGRRIFPSLTVEENLMMGAYVRRRGPWDFGRVYQLFPVLRERRYSFGTLLSGGEQQMLAIGRRSRCPTRA